MRGPLDVRSSWMILGAAAMALLACEDKKVEGGGAAAAASASVSAPATPAASEAATAAASATAAGAASASASGPVVVPDAIAAQHVLVAWKGAKGAAGVTRSKADARKRAEEALAKAKGGADFSAVVAEYSEDPGSKDRQGSLGKFTRDKMQKPFADAAFALAVDEISGIVETPFGFHIIKRNQ